MQVSCRQEPNRYVIPYAPVQLLTAPVRLIYAPVQLLTAPVQPICDPTGKPWDNFATVLYWYWVHYCYAEGLNRSHHKAHQILMFLFYGTYIFRGKETPIIHAIQKSVMCGRHRFSATKHAEAYKEFANALIKNPDCMRFLKDQGANDAPPEFLAAVEKVFRAVALKDKFSMGPKAMSSRKWWRQRDIWWRKREVSEYN